MWRINSITVWLKATLPRSLSQTAITTTWHPQIRRCFVAAALNKAHGWTSYQVVFCYQSWTCSPHLSRWNMGLWTLKAFLFQQQKWFCLMYVLSRPISLRVWKQLQERKVSIFQVDDLVGRTQGDLPTLTFKWGKTVNTVKSLGEELCSPDYSPLPPLHLPVADKWKTSGTNCSVPVKIQGVPTTGINPEQCSKMSVWSFHPTGNS